MAVADDLNLRLMRDGFEVRVQHAAFGVEGFPMAVVIRLWVEAFGEFELRLGCQAVLVLEHDDLVLVEDCLELVEVGVWKCPC